MKTDFERCEQCVLSSAFPKVKFDENGVCNFCRDQAVQATNDQAVIRAKSKIEALLLSPKNQPSEYDAILCYSGGKDSTLALIRTVSSYGLKVLAVTLDNGFMSPMAFANIRTVVDQLGVDHIIIRPSSKFFKELIKASTTEPIYSPKSLLRISAGCNSCISIVNNLALKCALEKKIPLIITGFNIGQIPANAIVYKNHYKFLQESREPYLHKLRKLLGNDVDDYLCISDELIDQAQFYPHTVNILCLENCNEATIYKEIEKYGWKQPDDVDGCSSNCRLNVFNNYMHQKIYHFHPYELELSHLIRKGQLTRNEALTKIYDCSDSQLQDVVTALDFPQAQLNTYL